MGVKEELARLGLELPPVPKPVAAYVPAVRFGRLVQSSGQLPSRDGTMLARGIVGRDVTIEIAATGARQCALNALAAIASVADLDRIARVVKVSAFVASGPDFVDHPKVANGASELLVAVFGERGKHARAAIGCSSLPLGAAVEIDILVELEEGTP